MAAAAAASCFFPVLFLFFLARMVISCRLDTFYCEKTEKNNPVVKTCGRSNVKCDNGSVLIQFYGEGPWYHAENIEYPERTIKILDTNAGLLSGLNSVDCDFFYNLSAPILEFQPAWMEKLEPNIRFFDCRPESYDFSRDVLGKSLGSPGCLNYDLHYTYQPRNPPRNDTCSSDKIHGVELELMFQDDRNGHVTFFLRSLGFSKQRKLDAHCFGCVITGDKCGAVNVTAGRNSSYSCSSSSRERYERCPPSNMKGNSKGPARKLLVIGFSVAGVVLLLTSCAVFLVLRRRFKRLGSSSKSLFTSPDPSSVGNEAESNHSECYQTPLFTYKELEEATSGFDPSKELGDGGFGTVYKGKLKDGRVVAVKRLYENNHRRMQQFRNEVEILNRLRHQNLVTLYGCTRRDSPKLMLVYEFVSNGTVADHLHGCRAGERLLTWPLRVSVAVETAEALAYLHAVQPQIVHRDVKTSNILLDGDLHVKVADFGLSRLFPNPGMTHVSTAPQGTPGYLDPEYHQCYHLTEKSDVYSFGVVLVELLTSMPAVDITRDRNDINLSNMMLRRIPDGRVGEIVDPRLGYGSNSEVTTMVDEVAAIAFRCLQAERDLRPTMEEVLHSLRAIAAGGLCVPGSKADNDNNRDVSITVDHQRVRDDTYLLDSPPFSPDSQGAADWPTRSTTPTASR